MCGPAELQDGQTQVSQHFQREREGGGDFARLHFCPFADNEMAKNGLARTLQSLFFH